MPKKILTHKINPDIIKTETENDIYSSLFFKNNSLVQLTLSYSSFNEKRTIEIKFSKCLIIFDLLTGIMKIFF